MQSLIHDLLHALRIHRATPISSGLTVVALGAALAFLASFLTLHSTLKPQPPGGFEDPERLVTVSAIVDGYAQTFNRLLLDRLGAASTGLEAVAGVSENGVRWTRGNGSGEVASDWVTEGYFDGLRPTIALGRGLEAADHAADGNGAAVLSHAFWQREFGGRSDIVGQTLELEIEQVGAEGSEWGRIDSVPIVGVMGPEVQASFGQGISIWLPAAPLMTRKFSNFGVDGIADRIAVFRAVARKADDRSASSIEGELAATLVGNHPDAVVPTEGALRVDPGFIRDPLARDEQLKQLQLLLTLTVLVALVAAINTGLYLLARAPARSREMAIREALGATRFRLARQLCVESLLLMMLALALALVLAGLLTGELRELPFFQRADWRTGDLIDLGVLGALAAIALLMTAIAAAAPITVMNRAGIHAGARRTGRAIGTFQRVGSALQVVVAIVVTAVATGLAGHLWELDRRDIGYDRESVVVLVPTYPQSLHVDVGELEAHQSRRNRIRAALGTVTAFEAIGFGLPVPGGQFRLTMGVGAVDADGETVDVQTVSGDAAFGDVLGLRVLHGDWPDSGDASSVVIERRLAERLFGRVDVAGETFAVSSFPGIPPSLKVGAVIDDVALAHPDDDQDPLMIAEAAPFANLDRIVLRTELTPAAVRSAVQALIDAGSLELEITDVYALEAQVARLMAEDRARFRIALAAALVTILLAVIGFYGTQRFLADSNRREFAIRASIGAPPEALFGISMLRAMLIGAPGVALAVPAAWIAIERLKPSVLPAQLAAAPFVAGATAALVLALLFAALGPAVRSARIAPATYLKDD